jgi:hypothetical protein
LDLNITFVANEKPTNYEKSITDTTALTTEKLNCTTEEKLAVLSTTQIVIILFIYRKWIQLTNNNSTATNTNKWTRDQLALVEGVVLKKGSSIRFKI